MDGSEEDGAPILGFLFGNVDENNVVEADYLDEVIFVSMPSPLLSSLAGLGAKI
jgi:hypothetical protein